MPGMDLRDALQSEFSRIERRALKRGEARLLRRQLTRRHGELPHSVAQRLEKASTEEIERWADRVLTAKTLDDIFK